MPPNFFTQQKGRDNVGIFFERFPATEVWRFFVERSRYDSRDYAYGVMRDAILKIVSDGRVLKINPEDVDAYLQTVSLKDISKLASPGGFNRAAMDLSNLIFYFFKFSKEDERSFKDYIEMLQAWNGFEETEPGYLLGMANGFSMIVEKLREQKECNSEFIKSLHCACMKNIKVLMCGEPGKFRRQLPASWTLDSTQNTLEGIFEILEYMKSDECKGLEFQIGLTVIGTRDKTFNSREKAEWIWSEIKKGSSVSITTSELLDKISGNLADIEAYLAERCDSHLKIYKKEISEAESKKDVLTAIFKFLKFTVLHHPFADGVGRTMSMLETQYLLMSNNLLPVILENSNFIPGWSVQEMVDHYLILEKEMEEVLKDPTYLSSKQFAEKNVHTPSFLAALPEAKRGQFNLAVEQFQHAITSYFEGREHKIDVNLAKVGFRLN